MPNPRLWSPEDPYLYTLDLKGERFRYGIRTVAFDAARGLLKKGKIRRRGPLKQAALPLRRLGLLLGLLHLHAQILGVLARTLKLLLRLPLLPNRSLNAFPFGRSRLAREIQISPQRLLALRRSHELRQQILHANMLRVERRAQLLRTNKGRRGL